MNRKIILLLNIMLVCELRSSLIKIDFFQSMKNGTMKNINKVKQDPRWIALADLFERNFLTDHLVNPIPKKIHQIWLGPKPVPATMERSRQSLLKYNSGWEYKLWRDSDVKNFGLKNQKMYEWETNWGAKADIVRYEILEREGGVCLDHDFECLANLEELHNSCDFYAGLAIDEEPTLFTGIMGSTPNHPVIKLCVSSLKIFGSQTDFNDILQRTAAYHLTRCFMSLINSIGNKMVALPTSYFYPFPGAERFCKDKEKIQLWIKPESLMIHYWATSWQK